MRTVRIKGTDIYVKCMGIGETPNGQKGIECQYLDGRFKNATEVIPGDCLVEECY